MDEITQKITKRVIELVADEMDVSIYRITPASTLEELGADSLDLQQLKMEIEEDFSLDAIDVEWDEQQVTIADLVELVKRSQQES